MLTRIKTALELRALARSAARIRASYAEDILKARSEKKNSEAISLIEDGERWELEFVYDEIEHLHTKALVRLADKYRVPLPEEGWERSRQLGYRYLTDQAYSALRTAIRAEKGERWSARLQWMPALVSLITSVAGLLGILVGLLAVLKK